MTIETDTHIELAVKVRGTYRAGDPGQMHGPMACPPEPEDVEDIRAYAKDLTTLESIDITDALSESDIDDIREVLIEAAHDDKAAADEARYDQMRDDRMLDSYGGTK